MALTGVGDPPSGTRVEEPGWNSGGVPAWKGSQNLSAGSAILEDNTCVRKIGTKNYK